MERSERNTDEIRDLGPLFLNGATDKEKLQRFGLELIGENKMAFYLIDLAPEDLGINDG